MAIKSGLLDTDWMLELALLYDELEIYDQANEIYDRVIALKVDEAVAYYGKAILQSRISYSDVDRKASHNAFGIPVSKLYGESFQH